jgi:hypothetical protein
MIDPNQLIYVINYIRFNWKEYAKYAAFVGMISIVFLAMVIF